MTTPPIPNAMTPVLPPGLSDYQRTIALYTTLHIPFSSGEGKYLPVGKYGNDNLLDCCYVSFFAAEGNRITHYFTTAGVYWNTHTGHQLL